MSKRLVVLGNGFDLACGLSSRVSDFVSYELKKENKGKMNFIIFLVNVIYKNTAFVGDNWCDFEEILRHFCFKNSSYLTAKKVLNAKINGFTRKDYSETLIDEDAYTQYFKDRIIDYKVTSFDQFFHFELLDFEKKFCLYLKRNEHFLLNHFQSKHNLLDLITEESQTGCILSFNYTKPFVNEYKYFKVSNVHGEYIKHNIIMGVDITNLGNTNSNGQPQYNYKNIGDKIFLLKTYRKMINDIDYPNLPDILDDKIKIISFFGHSLSEQDYSYFQSIFDYYHIYDSDVVLDFCYTEYLSRGKELDLLSGRVFKLINEYGETLSNKDHGKNLLHKLLLEKRLRLRELPLGFNKTIEIKGFRD